MAPLQLRPAIEALLFSSDQPLTLALLADALEADAASAADEAAVEPEAAAAVPEPEPDILGVGRIRRLSPDPPPAI